MPRQPALRVLLASTVSCGSSALTSARPASARTWSGSSSLLLRFGELPSTITSSHSSRSISSRCPRSASRSPTCSWCSLTIVGILVLLKDLDFVLVLEPDNRLEERSRTQVDPFLLLQTKPRWARLYGQFPGERSWRQPQVFGLYLPDAFRHVC